MISLIKILFRIWLIGLVLFCGYVFFMKSDDFVADKAVVFTGDYGRISTGVELLKEGKIEWLYITGVNSKINVQAEKELFKDIDYERYKRKIILGKAATTTEENGEEISHWFNEGEKVVLITSNYHLPRSMLVASKYSNATFIAYPVESVDLFSVRGVKLLISEYTKFIYVYITSFIK